MSYQYDYIILGAGIYGIFLACKLAEHFPSKTILILEKDEAPFLRGSYINQARVHKGYHYPRSLHTALKSAKYYQRFSEDFDFAINNKFAKFYAISKNFSYVSPDDFEKFCEAANIPCSKVKSSRFFKNGLVDSTFLTEETSMDAKLIIKYYNEKIRNLTNITVRYNFDFISVEKGNNSYTLRGNEDKYISEFVVNTTYASTNQIIEKFGYNKFPIKYELAELCLCDVSTNIKNVGLTVMDGPFFSIMPFGLSEYHSLSSVHFTPHKTSHELLPYFHCMEGTSCSPAQFNNCNTCINKPQTAWNKMSQLAHKYLNDDIIYNFQHSLITIKPILERSEVSDSRPTLFYKHSTDPYFVSVLSGKFNTIYDLEEILSW